jgi:uncharacterized membrane protein
MDGFVGSVSHVLYAGLAFIGVHVLTSTPLRAAIVGRIGEQAFQGLFSLLSVVLIVWLLLAYADAPYREVWPPAIWARHLPLGVMPFAFIFLVFGLTNPSPAIQGAQGKLKTGDAATGFLKVTRHPLFWGIALWALAHIPANGDLASLYFFGTFAFLALVGMPLQDRKKEETVGAEWGPFAMRTSIIPFLATLQGRNSLKWSDITWWRVLLGLALYAVFLFGHEFAIGVPVLPV